MNERKCFEILLLKEPPPLGNDTVIHHILLGLRGVFATGERIAFVLWQDVIHIARTAARVVIFKRCGFPTLGSVKVRVVTY